MKFHNVVGQLLVVDDEGDGFVVTVIEAKCRLDKGPGDYNMVTLNDDQLPVVSQRSYWVEPGFTVNDEMRDGARFSFPYENVTFWVGIVEERFELFVVAIGLKEWGMALETTSLTEVFIPSS